MKTILFYRKSQYGQEREFVHPDNQRDAQTISELTGKRTIDSHTRGLIQMLTAGTVIFKEVIAP